MYLLDLCPGTRTHSQLYAPHHAGWKRRLRAWFIKIDHLSHGLMPDIANICLSLPSMCMYPCHRSTAMTCCEYLKVLLDAFLAVALTQTCQCFVVNLSLQSYCIRQPLLLYEFRECYRL
jgi:hypothetical protein